MSKGSTQRPGTGYRENFANIFKKGNTMPVITDRPADVIAWMNQAHPGKSVYDVIAHLRWQLALTDQFPGIDIDRAHERRRDAGSGQPLQFYEGPADRRSEAVPGGLPDVGGAEQ